MRVATTLPIGLKLPATGESVRRIHLPAFHLLTRELHLKSVTDRQISFQSEIESISSTPVETTPSRLNSPKESLKILLNFSELNLGNSCSTHVYPDGSDRAWQSGRSCVIASGRSDAEGSRDSDRLVECRGHLVEKEELMKGVWPDSLSTDTGNTHSYAHRDPITHL